MTEYKMILLHLGLIHLVGRMVGRRKQGDVTSDGEESGGDVESDGDMESEGDEEGEHERDRGIGGEGDGEGGLG
jgi:hypothetical protein